ncbi:hypothetical protein, partial [Streptomyces clavuligerus]
AEEHHLRHWWSLRLSAAGESLAACHLIGSRPVVPDVLWLECAAEAATRLLPGPVRAMTGVRFERPPEPGASGGPPPLWIGAQPPVHPPARGPAAVRVVIRADAPEREPPDPPGPPVAEATVHIGPLARAPAPLRLPRWPARPSTDPCQQPGGPLLLSGPFTALTRIQRHPWGGSGEFVPGPGDPAGATAGCALPLLALDCLLRMQCQPPLARGDLLPVYVPLRLAAVEFFAPYPDSALARLPVVLLHRPAPAPDSGVLTLLDPVRPVLRLTVAANRLLGRYDSRAGRWERPSAPGAGDGHGHGKAPRTRPLRRGDGRAGP